MVDSIYKRMCLTLRSLTLYIYGAPILDVSRSHTTTQHSRQAAHLLKSWVRIPPGAWIFVCCECRVLSGRGLCDELITRTEESYRLCCVVVCDLETSRIGAPYIYDVRLLRVNIVLFSLNNRLIITNTIDQQLRNLLAGLRSLGASLSR